MNSDPEAPDAAAAPAASESRTTAAGLAPTADREEAPARRPPARRKSVPPVHGGGATPVQPAAVRSSERQKPSVDAENASRRREAVQNQTAGDPPEQRPAADPPRGAARPVASGASVLEPGKQPARAASAAARSSAVHGPQTPGAKPAGAAGAAPVQEAEQHVAREGAEAQQDAGRQDSAEQLPREQVPAREASPERTTTERITTEQPEPERAGAVQLGTAQSKAEPAATGAAGGSAAPSGATAVGAAAKPQTSSNASIAATEAAPAAPEASSGAHDEPGGPPREPRTKKRKGPEPGAARPLDHPRQRVEIVLAINDLVKRFGPTTAVAGVTLQVRAGSFFGLVGPNGAGKTTTLSMVTGLLRPDSGSVVVHGADVWSNPVVAKRNMGVLPDSLRLFDRLTGAQLLYYSGVLRGLDSPTVQSRTLDLAEAFSLTDALDRLVTDYSAGMTKKIALAAAMIHSPRLLVLDEPFESVDPVSAANVTEILQRYVAAGGTVVLSSHSMDLIQRICDDVAIVVNGRILASGPVDQVRGGETLEERFVELAGGRRAAEGMEWLHSFSD